MATAKEQAWHAANDRADRETTILNVSTWAAVLIGLAVTLAVFALAPDSQLVHGALVVAQISAIMGLVKLHDWIKTAIKAKLDRAYDVYIDWQGAK